MSITIDVWTDYLCPYCYVTSTSLALLKRQYDIDVQYHMYEIKRDKPVAAISKRQTLINVLRPHFADIAEREYGLNINQGPTQINSRLALIATKVAASRGKAHAFFHRVMRAYWEEAQAINRPTVLMALAVDVGLDGYEFGSALSAPQYSIALAADISQAHQRQIKHVPTLFINGELHVGAMPYDALKSAIVELEAAAKSPKSLG